MSINSTQSDATTDTTNETSSCSKSNTNTLPDTQIAPKVFLRAAAPHSTPVPTTLTIKKCYTDSFPLQNLQRKGEESLVESQFSYLENSKDPTDQWKRLYYNLDQMSRDKLSSKSNPFSSALLPNNLLLNRYRNILSNEDTRVVLTNCSDTTLTLPCGVNRNILSNEDTRVGKGGVIHCSDTTDYINANRLTLPCGGKELVYILTQGPLGETVDHFWHMIWQERCPVIAMLNKLVEDGRDKCFKYYPLNEGDEMTTNRFTIKCSKQRKRLKYIVSYLKLTDNSVSNENSISNTNSTDTTNTTNSNGNETTRNVTHMQYTDWPDFGVPANPQTFLDFLQKVREKVDNMQLIIDQIQLQQQEKVLSDSNVETNNENNTEAKPDENLIFSKITDPTELSALTQCSNNSNSSSTSSNNSNNKYMTLNNPIGPIVVHCSAGVGRSGTFVLVDICTRQLELGDALKEFDIQEVLLDMREQRYGCIQTAEQLRFCYMSIITALQKFRNGESIYCLNKKRNTLPNVHEEKKKNVPLVMTNLNNDRKRKPPENSDVDGKIKVIKM